ncbi:MAG: glutamate racemase [Oscillospiraceae bacterium]|nr:glutamate racemase [Oscillospiraceae bacterium]
MDNRPIGVFDSGLGGLTAVKELRRILPRENIVYFGDTGRVPYGNRGRDTILAFAAQDMAFLKQHDVKMLVAACGTISSVMTEQLAGRMGIPFTGVVLPTAQAACAASTTGVVGVIGTSATIRSGSFAKAIHNIRGDVKVLGKSCPLFVSLVENGYIASDNPVVQLVTRDYLRTFDGEADMDTLILGCTHFPLIYDSIAEYFHYNVTLIDSGRATAQYVQSFLTERNMLCEQDAEGTADYYVSDNTDDFSAVAERFLGGPLGNRVHHINVEELSALAQERE